MHTYTHTLTYMHIYKSDFTDVQPVAFGVSFLQYQISLDDLVLWVSFTTFR